MCIRCAHRQALCFRAECECGQQWCTSDYCKIQNNVSFNEGVIFEDYVFCGPSMVFTNLSIPVANTLRWAAPLLETRFCERFRSGHCTIVADTDRPPRLRQPAPSVTRDIPDYALVVATPAPTATCWVSEPAPLQFDANGMAVCGKTGWVVFGKRNVPSAVTPAVPARPAPRVSVPSPIVETSCNVSTGTQTQRPYRNACNVPTGTLATPYRERMQLPYRERMQRPYRNSCNVSTGNSCNVLPEPCKSQPGTHATSQPGTHATSLPEACNVPTGTSCNS
jgi:hypothetical protein